jgi:hypothetical protein
MNQDQMMQLLAAMNPELAPILSMLFQVDVDEDAPKRKPSAYNRRYAAAYRRIKKKKTLKNGSMAKGFGGVRGHKKIMKMAHDEARKGGKKK